MTSYAQTADPRSAWGSPAAGDTASCGRAHRSVSLAVETLGGGSLGLRVSLLDVAGVTSLSPIGEQGVDHDEPTS